MNACRALERMVSRELLVAGCMLGFLIATIVDDKVPASLPSPLSLTR